MERAYVTLGAVAWLLALAVGLFMPTVTVVQDVPEPLRGPGGRTVSTVTPSPVSGPLAGGFAVAGGLCFVAAGLAGRNQPAHAPRPMRAAQGERDAAAAVAALEGGAAIIDGR